MNGLWIKKKLASVLVWTFMKKYAVILGGQSSHASSRSGSKNTFKGI
jgi:hypothetical protein